MEATPNEGPTTTRADPSSDTGPDRIGWLALACTVLALVWAPLSLWPGRGWPAWPAVSLGLCGLLLALGRGRPWIRAGAAIGGLTAVLVGAAQIAALWAVAAFAPV